MNYYEFLEQKKHTTNDVQMKKLTLILIWYIFVNSSVPESQYITFYENENEVHKIRRENYLEFQEFNSLVERPGIMYTEYMVLVQRKIEENESVNAKK